MQFHLVIVAKTHVSRLHLLPLHRIHRPIVYVLFNIHFLIFRKEKY